MHRTAGAPRAAQPVIVRLPGCAYVRCSATSVRQLDGMGPIMKRPALLLSVVLAAAAGAAAGSAAPLGAQERPPDAWLLMANPAEQMASGITVGWHARVPGTFVEVATTADSAFTAPRTVVGVCEPVTHLDTATGVAHEVLKCRADVGGLEGGRAFRYRAGREVFSRPGHFVTASPGQSFSFLYMSDVHVHNPLPGRLRAGVALLEQARALEPDVRFTVLGGDMLAYGSAYGAWDSLAASPLVTTQMTAFTAGNHEFYDHTAKSRGPGYFNTFVHNPANGAYGVANTSYFFRYGNALFLSISSEDSWSSDALLEAQKAWFRRVVAENPATFIIAWTHRPFYNGSTSNAGHALTNRTNWSPLFDELGVDLVLSGHDHVYVRTAPTTGGSATSEPRQGTVYLTSTTVGDRYMDADPANPCTNLERIIGGETLGTIFAVGHDAIRLRTYDTAGAIVDEAVLPARRRDEAAAAGARHDDARWWRGNLHTHSLWSDGGDFPEMIAAWYREHGYHFVAFTEHDMLQAGERWIDIHAPDEGWPPRNASTRTALPGYRARFGAMLDERQEDGRHLVRLRGLDEHRHLFEEPGRFLLIMGEEITDRDGAHVNMINADSALQPAGGATNGDRTRANLRAVAALQQRSGRPMLGIVNHPNFRWALTAETLAGVKEARFFEVYSGHLHTNNDGDATRPGTEGMWDEALTLRHAAGGPPLYGIAADDAHEYRAPGDSVARPGRGWVMVRAQRLEVAALLEAMERGDFYASTGVRLRSLRRDAAGIAVEVEPAAGVTYRIAFIGTRVAPGAGPAHIGEVLAEVEGTRAEYAFRGDERYVRATITSSAPHSEPTTGMLLGVQRAWVQPVFR
jgi:hypothetical protein